MDRPEWVRRVAPPRRIIAKRRRQQTKSQRARRRWLEVAVALSGDKGAAFREGDPRDRAGVWVG
jgi:hypothetical protein